MNALPLIEARPETRVLHEDEVQRKTINVPVGLIVDTYCGFQQHHKYEVEEGVFWDNRDLLNFLDWKQPNFIDDTLIKRYGFLTELDARFISPDILKRCDRNHYIGRRRSQLHCIGLDAEYTIATEGNLSISSTKEVELKRYGPYLLDLEKFTKWHHQFYGEFHFMLGDQQPLFKAVYAYELDSYRARGVHAVTRTPVAEQMPIKYLSVFPDGRIKDLLTEYDQTCDGGLLSELHDELDSL